MEIKAFKQGLVNEGILSKSLILSLSSGSFLQDMPYLVARLSRCKTPLRSKKHVTCFRNFFSKMQSLIRVHGVRLSVLMRDELIGRVCMIVCSILCRTDKSVDSVTVCYYFFNFYQLPNMSGG